MTRLKNALATAQQKSAAKDWHPRRRARYSPPFWRYFFLSSSALFSSSGSTRSARSRSSSAPPFFVSSSETGVAGCASGCFFSFSCVALVIVYLLSCGGDVYSFSNKKIPHIHFRFKRCLHRYILREEELHTGRCCTTPMAALP